MTAIGSQLTSPEAGWSRIDETDPSISFIGNGWSSAADSNPYGGSYRHSSGIGDQVRFNFTGTRLRVIAFRWSGESTSIDVFIDGIKNTNYSARGSNTSQVLLCEIIGLSNNEHYVSIVNNDTVIDADAYDIDAGCHFKPYNENLNYYLFLKDDYTCYSYNGTALSQVSADWRLETDDTKKTLFLAGTRNIPAAATLQTLGKFKVIMFSANAIMNKPNCSVSAVPKKYLIKPKGLISIASFDGIDNISLTTVLSGTGALHLLVTTDLTTYKTWDGTSWNDVDTSDLSAVESSGLTPTTLSAINRATWDLLTTGKGGIGFAYLPTIEAISDSASTDKLIFQVDMKGSWDRAVYGTDFTYGYPQNNILRIKILTNGDYKINYHESASA